MAFEKLSVPLPVLREGVTWSVTQENTIDIDYRQQGCVIDCGNEAPAVLAILEKLKVECTEPRVYDDMEIEVIDSLDKLGLITTSTKQHKKPLMNGMAAFHQAMRFAQEKQGIESHSIFYQLMKEDKVTREQLIGFVLEYLHITRMAHKIMGAAVTFQDSRNNNDTLLQFFKEELFHDRLIENSLESIGYGQDKLKHLCALPSTFGLCSLLSSFAFQSPLSFKSSLYLFERPFHEFDSEFKRNAARFGLPDDFVKPILVHSDINKNGDHDEISTMLLSDVSAVSDEDVINLKLNLWKIIQLMSWQDREVVEYYGDPESSIPRVFN